MEHFAIILMESMLYTGTYSYILPYVVLSALDGLEKSCRKYLEI